MMNEPVPHVLRSRDKYVNLAQHLGKMHTLKERNRSLQAEISRLQKQLNERDSLIRKLVN